MEVGGPPRPNPSRRRGERCADSCSCWVFWFWPRRPMPGRRWPASPTRSSRRIRRARRRWRSCPTAGSSSPRRAAALKLVGAGSATTLTTIPVCTASEMGLLGIAIDPSFNTNGFVYLYRTAPDSGDSCADAIGRFNQVVRVTMSGNTVVPGSLTAAAARHPADEDRRRQPRRWRPSDRPRQQALRSGG